MRPYILHTTYYIQRLFIALVIVSLVIGSFWLGSSEGFAWTNPSVAPPGGDAGGLINISSSSQAKLGSLTVSGTLGIGASSLNSSAIAQIDSTAKGLLPPRMTQTQRDAIATPQAGLFIYNTTAHQFNIYANSAWGAVAGSGDANWTQSGTNIYDTATSSLVGVGDANPQVALSVSGVISAPSSATVRFQASGATAGSGGNGSIYFLDSTGTTRSRFDTATTVPRTASLSSYLGSGADGAVTFASNTNLNTWNHAGRTCADGGDAVNYSVTALTLNTATLSTTPSAGCLNANDDILLINLRGQQGYLSNLGNYEVLTVQSVVSNVVTFTANKTKYYGQNSGDDTNIGTGSSNQVVMLQRVPQYTNVTVNAGVTLTPNGFDGLKGGVVFFLATGTVTVNGSINAVGLGYAGGTVGYGTGSTLGCHYAQYGSGPGQGPFYVSGTSGVGGACVTGDPGKAGVYSGGGGGAYNYDGAAAGGSGISNTGASGGGGGGTGGYIGSSVQGSMGGGGGGGGHATGGGGGQGTGGVGNGANGTTVTSGTGGTAGWYSCCSGNINEGASGGGGGGAGNYGSADLTKLTIGSGGGAGGNGCNTDAGCSGFGGLPGGAGGGIVAVYANTINIAGTITANGIAAGANSTGGGGGAGAGGSVKLLGASLSIGTNFVTASGGAANGGGAGGNGRIALDYNTTLSGSTTPAAYTQNIGTNDPDTTKYYGTLYTGATNVSSQDLAEYYESADPTLTPGNIVSIGQDGKLHKSDLGNLNALLGVISTNPGVTLGTNDTGGNNNQQKVALAGKVPTLVTTTNGPIEPGDLITLDPNNPGMGTKLTTSGWYIGRALQPLTQGQGTIEVFAGGGYIHQETNNQSFNNQEVLVQSVANQYLQQFGVTLQKGVAAIQDLTARKIVLNVLHLTGLQMPDTQTNNIYCTSVYNGVLRTEQGNCQQ